MDNLKKIINFVTPKKHKDRIPFYKILNYNEGQKIVRFAAGLEKGEFDTDEQAIKKLYGSSRHASSYRMLKSRFKMKMVDLINLRDTRSLITFSYDRSNIQLHKNLLAAHILYQLDHRIQALDLFKPALQSAIYFNHTTLALKACLYLMRDSAFAGYTKEHGKYVSLFNNLLQLNHNEHRVASLDYKVTAAIVNVASYNAKTKKLIADSLQQAKHICRKHHSHTVTTHSARLAVRYHHSRGEYKKIITVTAKYISYLQAHPQFYQHTRAGEFALMQMEACLQLGYFDDGRTCAKKCTRYFVPYTSPWFVFNEYYFLLAMRTGNYTNALDIFYNVFNKAGYKHISSIQKERWHIFEAWLNFVLPDELPKKKFNLFRFLNEVPLSGHDKTGYNFSVLTAQIILLINMGDTDKLLDIELSFRQYLHRTIKRKNHPRHYLFGVMMRLLFRNHFKISGIEKEIKRSLDKLLSKKLSVYEETEIIPYPILWEMVLEKCRLYIQKSTNNIAVTL